MYGLILLGFGHDGTRILCCGTCLIMFNNCVCVKSFEHGAHLRELCSAFCERSRNTLSPRLVMVACGFNAVWHVSACTVIVGGILRHYSSSVCGFGCVYSGITYYFLVEGTTFMFANNKDVNKFKKAMNSIGSCLFSIGFVSGICNIGNLLAYLVYYKNHDGSLFTDVSDEEIEKISKPYGFEYKDFINDAAEIFQTPHINGGITTHYLAGCKEYDTVWNTWNHTYTVSYAITELPPYAYAAYKVSRQRSCIEKNGSHLSDMGALNLFKRELNHAMDSYGIKPDVSLSDILRDTINASHGVIPTSKTEV